VEEEIVKKGYCGIYEKEYRRKDGTIVPIELRTYLIRDTSGQPAGMWGLVRDITERKQAEEELSRSEDQLRVLVKTVKSGIALVDEDGRFSVVNPSFTQIFGLDDEQDILNVNSQDWSRWEVYGEDRKLLRVDDHPVRKAVMTGKPVKDQLVAIRNPGANELTWLLISAEPILKEDGQIYRVICTYHDITKRKKAEDALRKSESDLKKAQKIAHIGSWEWDLASNLVTGSEELYRLFSLKPDPTTFFQQYTDLLVPEDRQRVLDALNETIKGNVPYNIDYQVVLYNGNKRFIHAEAVAIYDNGKPVKIIGTAQDITERKWAEETLKKSHETLEERVRERTSELEKAYKYLRKVETVRKQEIHHRIKNNLQVISSLLDLQAEKFRGKTNIEDSQILKAFQESQDRVISMALIHEELHKGGKVDTLNISHYIEELANNLLLTYRVCNNGISLDMDIEKDIFFDMDTSVPLGIIVNELISNSLKHAFPSGDKGEIQIKLYREKNGEFESEDCNLDYVLVISDNGIGIPKDLDIEDIDSLGLQLVTSLIDQLDGELDLKRNNGTEFIIRFTVEER
jgi:PAS domain S-box-containing protein